jgi:hypothetical protein
MSEGLIRNKNQVTQAIDFIGSEWGAIHPSDIDAVLEFDNEFLLLFEIKKKGNTIPVGQEIMLKRICNNWKGKSIVLKGEHNYKEEETIILNKCDFTLLYYEGTWRKPNKELNIGQAIMQLAKHWKIKKLLK